MYLKTALGVIAPAFAFLKGTSATQLNGTVSIPRQDTYLLDPFFAPGNETTNFVDTKTGNKTTDALLASARNAAFISYSPEFDSIFGPDPQLKLLAQVPHGNIFYEAGVWVPDRNEVWFSGDVESNDTLITVVNLESGQFHHPQTSQPVLVGNGGHYFNGKVYITTFGNETYAGGVVAIDPATYETETVVNSFFGLRFNGPDDITFVKRGNNAYMYFTDPEFSGLLNYSPRAVMPDAVWRFDPQLNDLQAVISRADILVPNGVASNANGSKLYLTDTPLDFTTKGYGQGGQTSGSPAIFVYDVDAELRPVNKRLFGIARSGFPDGIHVDDSGRVWTGEGEGVVIRNEMGTVLGIVNTEAIGEPKDTNLALAGDTLVIGGFTKLWTVKLAQSVISPARFHT